MAARFRLPSLMFMIGVASAGFPAWAWPSWCERLMGGVGAARTTPHYVLTDDHHREIEHIFAAEVPELEKFEMVIDLWTKARMAQLKPSDAMVVGGALGVMDTMSPHGIRPDDLLESVVTRPGMTKGVIKMIDEVHDLERLILGYEFSKRISSDRVPDAQTTDRDVEINRIYRRVVGRAEAEVLRALPRTVLLSEQRRIAALHLPWRERWLALGLLKSAAGQLPGFGHVSQRVFLGYAPDWRLSESAFTKAQARDVRRRIR